MEVLELLFGLVVLGALLGGALWFSKRQGAFAAAAGAQLLGADLRTMARWMFEQTGFQRADMLGAPLEAQVERSVAEAGQPLGRTHLVRHRDGFELHFEQVTEASGGGFSMRASWWTSCAPPFGLHVADRRLTGATQALTNAMTSLSRSFQPLFPQELALHDGALAARFRAWSTDPAQAAALLARPSLRAALLALPSVDFALREGGLTLSDPLQENLTGGLPAHALPGLRADQLVAAQAQGHDLVARLFACALGRA